MQWILNNEQRDIPKQSGDMKVKLQNTNPVYEVMFPKLSSSDNPVTSKIFQIGHTGFRIPWSIQ